MKRFAMLIAVLALVMSLAACGCTDKNAPNSGTTQNGGSSGTTQNGGNSGNHGSSITGQPGMNGSGNGMTGNNGNAMNGGGMNNGTNGGGIIGGMEDAVDNVGDAVDDLIGGNNGGMNNSGVNNAPAGNHTTGNNTGANATSFQQMISNARVHDTDGVLTDGENSHW